MPAEQFRQGAEYDRQPPDRAGCTALGGERAGRPAHAQRPPPCQASTDWSLRSVGRLHDLEVGLAEASPHEMCPNRTVRSLFTSPERSFFKPDPLLAPSNPLNYRAFDIRTKMAVVRLLRRKWAERDEKRPEVGPRAGPHGSDNLPGMAAVCGIPTADQERKKNVPTGRLGGGRGAVIEHSLCYISIGLE